MKMVFPGPNKCLWSYGTPDDSDFHWCEKPTVPGKSWCREHYYAPGGVFINEKSLKKTRSSIDADMSDPTMGQKKPELALG